MIAPRLHLDLTDQAFRGDTCLEDEQRRALSNCLNPIPIDFDGLAVLVKPAW